MNNVALWGGSGFLGINLARRLSREGVSVSINNSSCPQRRQHAQAFLEIFDAHRVKFENGDDMLARVRDFEIIYYLRARNDNSSNASISEVCLAEIEHFLFFINTLIKARFEGKLVYFSSEEVKASQLSDKTVSPYVALKISQDAILRHLHGAAFSCQTIVVPRLIGIGDCFSPRFLPSLLNALITNNFSEIERMKKTVVDFVSVDFFIDHIINSADFPTLLRDCISGEDLIRELGDNVQLENFCSVPKGWVFDPKTRKCWQTLLGYHKWAVHITRATAI